ncbi:MAG: hypothetical protein M1370_11375 [Bacteroidetes bacterium]|nr:hypothetical protein [Bacteroidota bacterium]
MRLDPLPEVEIFHLAAFLVAALLSLPVSIWASGHLSVPVRPTSVGLYLYLLAALPIWIACFNLARLLRNVWRSAYVAWNHSGRRR